MMVIQYNTIQYNTSEKNCDTSALQTVKEVTELLARGSFHLTKWLSNSKEVLSSIPATERVSSAADLNVQLSSEKGLGVTWDTQTDDLHVTAPTPAVEKATKREILRVVASIFDRLGLVSPFVLIAKLLLQDLWSSQQGWDAALADEQSYQWLLWLADLPRIADVRVPRWYGTQKSERSGLVETASYLLRYFGEGIWCRRLTPRSLRGRTDQLRASHEQMSSSSSEQTNHRASRDPGRRFGSATGHLCERGTDTGAARYHLLKRQPSRAELYRK